MKYVVGVDIGTSSARAVVFTEDLHPVSASQKEYAIDVPRPGWAEQDPDMILDAVLQVVGEAVRKAAATPDQILGIGFAAVMHSLIALGAEGDRLTNAWLWGDLRASAVAARLKKEAGDFFYRRTGCPVHSMYWPAKILWFRENLPEVWSRTRRLLSIKEYLLWRLTGRFAVDQSVAVATGILNIYELQWDPELLRRVGVGREMLSEPVLPLTALTGLKPWAAERMGVLTSTPVIIGASDGALSNVGSGAVEPGQMALMIGTSGAVRVLSDAPRLHPQEKTWCYYVGEGLWVPGGAINNGGNIMRWMRDNFADKEREIAARQGVDAYQILSDYAGEIPAGAGGLFFLPLLAGERSPNWEADARGVFFGLNLSHGKKHMARAIMEGVSFQLYAVYEALVEITGKPREIRASGGFTRSTPWLGIMADIFGEPLAVPRIVEGSAFGVAAMVLVAAGVMRDLTAVSNFITVERIIEPDMATHRLYQELYEINREIYRSSAPHFSRVAALQAPGGAAAFGALPERPV